jgi:hypothetical protein
LLSHWPNKRKRYYSRFPGCMAKRKCAIIIRTHFGW